jgi:hypothetical protein
MAEEMPEADDSVIEQQGPEDSREAGGVGGNESAPGMLNGLWRRGIIERVRHVGHFKNYTGATTIAAVKGRMTASLNFRPLRSHFIKFFLDLKERGRV